MKNLIRVLTLALSLAPAISASAQTAAALPAYTPIAIENQRTSLELQLKTYETAQTESAGARADLVKAVTEKTASMTPSQRMAVIKTLLTTLNEAATRSRGDFANPSAHLQLIFNDLTGLEMAAESDSLAR